MLSAQKDEEGVLLVTGSSDINSSVVNDTIVQKNGLLRVRGNLLGNLTIEPGAEVIIEGSVAGKIINRGGRLAVNHQAASMMTDGPAQAEACRVLISDSTTIASNRGKPAQSTDP